MIKLFAKIHLRKLGEDHMIKRYRMILIICLVTAILSGTVCSRVSAETKQEKKLVYVVLDDSGSMAGDRWQKAQYAIEVLAGLLNPEDRMELFYLNDGENTAIVGTKIKPDSHWSVDLSENGLQKSMEKTVSTSSAEGGTPFESVVKAWEKMLLVNEGYDKYWLVAITDGAYDKNSSYVRSAFERFVAQPLGPDNSKRLQLIYLVIGNDGKIHKNDQDKTKLEDQGIYCISAKNDNIVETIGEIEIGRAHV